LRNCVALPPVVSVTPLTDVVVRVAPEIEGEVPRTTEPVPVTAVIPVPFILNTFPVPAVSNVLLVNVSVVARPIKVSVVIGKVSVPVFEIEEIIGLVSVLLESV